ncbi:MAG TPA: hypothetical protein VFV92_05770 [Candidatus Bathyarchaeia archaeon]|nr:hypothetical protein [Candidatus Bathyarchaeia archaeon]
MEPDIAELLVSWLDKQEITWEMGPAYSKDENGNPYVTLLVGGEKAEGEEPKLFYTRFCTDMIEHFKSSLLQFLDGRTRIVWRTFPALEHEFSTNSWGFTTPKYQIRCRLTAY